MTNIITRRVTHRTLDFGRNGFGAAVGTLSGAIATRHEAREPPSIYDRVAARDVTPKAARRAKVKAAASELFATAGFHSAGVAQIAARSGVAIAQIYRDFAGKEDIIAEIVAANCRNFVASEDLRAHIAANDRLAARDWLLRLADPPIDDVARTLLAETVAESFRSKRIAALFDAMRLETKTSILAALDFLAPTCTSAKRKSVVADTILIVAQGVIHQSFPRYEIEECVSQNLRDFLEHQIATLSATPDDPA